MKLAGKKGSHYRGQQRHRLGTARLFISEARKSQLRVVINRHWMTRSPSWIESAWLPR